MWNGADRPEGAKGCSQGRKPLGTVPRQPVSPNGAIVACDQISALFPDVPLVIGYLVAAEEIEKLLLEGCPPM